MEWDEVLTKSQGVLQCEYGDPDPYTEDELKFYIVEYFDDDDEDDFVALMQGDETVCAEVDISGPMFPMTWESENGIRRLVVTDKSDVEEIMKAFGNGDREKFESYPWE